ncbi:zinc-binding dehydrogenase [Streptomyces sp. ST2-7A]|uniref:zinc-binding dehydrogenase n=1 Tax=Streptomyces sp. ST2-7A TaxID=2907214 RepID=UPI001F1F2899|nr:zinc-binding dehydrogenase [Streptomyces sp. ST2-7A]MCE7080214.1 zinc-binding dehydrogenase [Streptomyces sp. ST2-7A]
MRAIRLHAFGPPENLRLEEVPDPEPGPGEVGIAVVAAGVHLLDAALRAGRAGGFPLPELPTVPGREVAGTVDAVGSGVPERWLGRRVVAHLGMVPGGYAERAVTAVERLHELPADLPEDRAVALVGTGRTAAGILRLAAPGPSDTVLVAAAAGGIGSLLVGAARERGARVVGTAGGAAKVAMVRDLGADPAVDYTVPGWTDTVREALGGDRPVTVVCEGLGGEVARQALGLLAPGGRHLAYGWAATGFDGHGAIGPEEAERVAPGAVSRWVTGSALTEPVGGSNPVRTLEEEALTLAAEGVFRPPVTSFPLVEAARAHAALEGRATTGKVVLLPRGPVSS